MIICQCRVVSDREVEAAIAAGARDECALAAACGAGMTCGGCLPEMRERLAHHGACPDRSLEAADIRAALGVGPLTRSA